jgi:hypothetical protein
MSAIIALATPFVGSSAESTIEVTSEQSVTMVGGFPSLRSAITELCQRAHVELRAFEAADREVAVVYRSVPLAVVLEGLLREENYLVGVTSEEAGRPPRVAWIRVAGSGNVTPARRDTAGAAEPSGSTVPAMRFEVPATFGNAEFTSEDPEQRARALHSIAARLVASKQLMSADPQALAGALEAYPHARELLTQLRDEQEDPEVRARLDQVLASLR